MRTKFLAIILLCIPIFINAQTDIVLKLKTVDGFGMFTPARKLLSPYGAGDKPTVKDIPEDIVEYSIREFDIQPYNSGYQYVLNGQVSMEKFESSLRSRGIDRKLITASKYKHALNILFGTNKQNEYVIIIDENNNLSFSDDKKLILPKKKNADEEASIPENELPVIKTKFEYFDGLNVITVSIPLAILPYKGHTGITFTDSIENKYCLRIGIPTYKSQSVVINNKKYILNLSNSFTSLEYTSLNTQLLVQSDKMNDGVKSERVAPYSVGDVISFDNLQYKFENVSLWGDTVSLKYLGVNNRPEGFLSGMHLPKTKIQTIDNKDFDFEKYMGKYVLIDFWGSWCVPCIKLIPQIAAVNAKYKSKGLVMVSVAFDDNISKLKELIESKQMNWIHLIQNKENAEFVDKLKVTVFPTLILVDPSGKILYRDKSIDEIDEILSKCL